jgi:hypothetical protein
MAGDVVPGLDQERRVAREPVLSPRRMRACFRCLRCLLVVLILAGPVGAVDPRTSLRQLNHTSWSAKDGAPSQIRAIAETADGYIWFAGESGLFRFDGVRFEPFHTLSDQKLLSDATTALCATDDGGLWIGYQFGGASYWQEGTLRNYSERDGFPSTVVFQFAIQRDGTVWAATFRGPAYFDGRNWRIAGKDWNFDGDNARSDLVDRDGTLWVASPGKAFFLPLGSKAFTRIDLPDLPLFQVIQHPDGSVGAWKPGRMARDWRFGLSRRTDRFKRSGERFGRLRRA